MAGYLIPGVGWWEVAGTSAELLVPGVGALTQDGAAEQKNVPLLVLPLAALTPSYYTDPTIYVAPLLDLPLVAFAPAAGKLYDVPLLHLPAALHSPAMTWRATAPLLPLPLALHVPTAPGDAVRDVPLLSLTLNMLRPSHQWAVPSSVPATTMYRCYLTGDGEDPAVSDLELPIESFQARARSGDPTYLQVVVPNALAYASGVNARTNGDVVVYRGSRTPDGTEYLEEILRANLEDIRVDWGARSASMTLVGHKQTTNSTPKAVAMVGPSYRASISGRVTVRCQANTFLQPGDTAEFAALGESIEVGLVTWTVGRGLEQMEVQEASA